MVGNAAGLYYWAGPGTIRMIELKFPGAKINRSNLLQSYDYKNLKRLKEKFNLTDMWVSFSWGFSQQTEQVDYQFIRSKLSNFQKLGIRTHAYIQGCNLVLKEHADTDYFCRDWYGRLIPYHRGRKMTCPNNPHFLNYIKQKISLALKENFSGIFIDNINFGQFPLTVVGGWTTFFGCKCTYCVKLFKTQFQEEIPKLFKINSQIYDKYLAFRTRSITNFLTLLAQEVHGAGKLFGTNSFDPKHDPALMYGINLKQLVKIQDYLLFENHDLPRFGRIPKNNMFLKKIIQQIKKPIFVVSYKKGIGKDAQYSQVDFNAIYTESKILGYHPCYKGTEYVTKNIWHNLDDHSLTTPYLSTIPQSYTVKQKLLKGKSLLRFYNRFYNPIVTSQFENRYARKAFSWLYYRAIQ